MIILAERVPIEEAKDALARHSGLHKVRWARARWHTRVKNPSATAIVYTVYCSICDPLPETDEKGQ